MEYHAGVHVTKTVAFQTAISEKEATCREAFPHADDDGRWSTGSLFSPFVPEAFQRYYKFDSIYHQEVCVLAVKQELAWILLIFVHRSHPGIPSGAKTESTFTLLTGKIGHIKQV